jgi:hypothetical protein
MGQWLSAPSLPVGSALVRFVLVAGIVAEIIIGAI